jgi:hypothetical protein
MPTTLPHAFSAAALPRAKSEPRFATIILGSTAILLIPPLLLIFVAAACFGHGEISSESIRTALVAIADTYP